MWPFSILYRSRNYPGTVTSLTSPEEIARRIKALLAKQYADADAKEKEAWQWGQTGALVRRAAQECERILLPLPRADAISDYFRQVLPKLAKLAETYRSDADDADGYALGTVREVEKAVIAMAELTTSTV